MLNLFHQFEHNSLIVAVSISAGAIEIVGFIRDRTYKEDSQLPGNPNRPSDGPVTINQHNYTEPGQLTNITGGVQGPLALAVLLLRCMG
jgi:hypothetical protein